MMLGALPRLFSLLFIRGAICHGIDNDADYCDAAFTFSAGEYPFTAL